MHMKKNLAIAVAVALLAVPALGATNANAAYKGQNGTMLTMREVHKIHAMTTGHGPGGGGPVEPWGQEEEDGVGHFNGHTFDLPDNGGPIVTSLDGIKNPSAAQVNAALYGTSARNSKSAQVAQPSVNKGQSKVATAKNSTRPSTNNTQSGVQNGKLAQTGESNTGANAGIVGAIAAMVSIAFAGVEKFFKRA